MTMPLEQRLKQALREREAAGLYRRRQIIEGPQSVEVKLAGELLVNFSSNDYLGLASHPQVIKAMQQGAEQWGAGSGAAHLVSGHSSAHHALEEELADFTGRQRALLFSTGYMANLGTISALAGRGDSVFEDRLNHASLYDAAILSRARLKRYRHGHSEQLAQQLAAAAGHKLVVTDGVFSMDGDLAPLPALVAACQQHHATLMVDDAHGIGALGDQGGGSLAYFGLDAVEVPVLMGTLGKAFGTFGAFVAGSEALIETLIQQARSYVYTTALPPAVAHASRTSLRLLQQEDWRREQLQARVAQWRTGAAALGLSLMESASPIQPLLLGSVERATRVSAQLRQRGFLISAIRPPTVPDGTARLRITLSALHQESHVAALLDALQASDAVAP